MSMLCRNCGGELDVLKDQIIADDGEFEHFDCPDPELAKAEAALDWAFERLLLFMEAVAPMAREPSVENINAVIKVYNETMPGIHQVVAALPAHE